MPGEKQPRRRWMHPGLSLGLCVAWLVLGTVHLARSDGWLGWAYIGFGVAWAGYAALGSRERRRT